MVLRKCGGLNLAITIRRLIQALHPSLSLTKVFDLINQGFPDRLCSHQKDIQIPAMILKAP